MYLSLLKLNKNVKFTNLQERQFVNSAPRVAILQGTQ